MNKSLNAARWVSKNFFFITIAVLVLFYMRWFRLTPLVYGDDPTESLIVGCFLLVLFLLVSKALASTTIGALRFLLLILNITLLLINAAYILIHIPQIETTAYCNGVRYYITYGAPFGDEQWTYIQMSKWRGISYESHSLGYAPDAAGNEIICDEARKEAHFIRSFGNPADLIYIDGENPQRFEGHNGARLKNRL